MRKFLPTLSDLIDRLTITQIKIIKSGTSKNDELKKESIDLQHDIDMIIKEKESNTNAGLIKDSVAIAAINLEIWNTKDKMQENLENEGEYLRLLKLAHQLNGYRNRIKNNVNESFGELNESTKRTNFETDGLDIDLED